MGSSSPHPVRVAREAQGLTQEDVAYRAGVSLKTLQLIERGQGNPRRSTLKLICLALGLEPDEVAA